MKNLIEYIEENRVKEPIRQSEEWCGELYINTRSLYYDVPTKRNTHKVFAFVSYPTTPMPKNGYPAVLLIHGGNGTAFYEMTKVWADKGFVAISPDFNGMCAPSINERQIVNPMGGNSGFGALKDLYAQDNWAYFSVLSAMRAIDFLETLENVDKNNIFSCGLSWGGFIQLLLSSVDSRIKASSVIYSTAYVDQSKWGKEIFAEFSFTEKDIELWRNNIDPQNYLQNIAHPIFFTGGADDTAFKVINRQRTADKIPAEIYYGVRPSFPHSNFYGFEQPESPEFFRLIALGEKPFKPNTTFFSGVVNAHCNDLNVKTLLYYTKDYLINTDIQSWDEILFNESVPLPIDAKAFFVVYKFANGMQFSSKLFII